MEQTKKSTAFSAEVELAPITAPTLGVNEHLLQAMLVACENDSIFKERVINLLCETKGG